MALMLALLGMLVLYFAIHLIVNRGRIVLRYLVTAILYSFVVGLPVAYFSFFPERLDPLLYIIYYVAVLSPFFGVEVYRSLKRRQTWTRVLLNLAGVVLLLSSPFLEAPLKLTAILAGLVLVTAFIVYHFRYPHLNAMWLAKAAEKAAADVEKDRKFSPKPVVLAVESRRTSLAKVRGLTLIFKRRNAIVRMTKDFHERMGRPNMEQFARKLVNLIREEAGESKSV
jgi:hypothetical protein